MPKGLTRTRPASSGTDLRISAASRAVKAWTRWNFRHTRRWYLGQRCQSISARSRIGQPRTGPLGQRNGRRRRTSCSVSTAGTSAG